MLRIALVAVVNQRGEVLLRLRDEQSVVRPNRWSLPGGAVQDDEDPAAAARRWVHLQTGLTVDTEPVEVWHGFLPSAPVEVYFFAVSGQAHQADLVQSDQVENVFVPGPDVFSGRSFTPASGFVLGRFPDALHRLRGQWDPREVA